MEKNRLVQGIFGFIVFFALLYALWDFINYQTGLLAEEFMDPASQLVILAIPFVIIIAGIYGAYRLYKGSFGE